MAQEPTIFPEGMGFREPGAKTPAWIRGSVWVQVDKFAKWAQQHADDRGYVTIDIKLSKKEEYYMALNTFKRTGGTARPATARAASSQDEQFDRDIEEANRLAAEAAQNSDDIPF